MKAGLDVDVYALFQKYAEKVPLPAAIRPNGERRIEELESGRRGARAVMKRLESMMALEARCVGGQTLGEILSKPN